MDKARSRELGGTGLGLAIVKHIVLAHGGGLRIESRITHGTIGRVALPVDTPRQVWETPANAPRSLKIKFPSDEKYILNYERPQEL